MLDKLGAVIESEHFHHVAFSGRRAAFGLQSSLTLESADALSSHFLSSSRAYEAEALQREALEARRGEPSRDQVTSRSILGQALKQQGRLQEALPHFEAAYTLCSMHLGGPEGPNTYAAGSNLASALQDLGRLDEAGAFFRISAVGLQRTLGKSHINTRGAIQNYQKFLRDTGMVDTMKP